MVAKRASRPSPAAVHAGRTDSLSQRGRGIWRRPSRTGLRRGRNGTVVESRAVYKKTLFYAHDWQAVSHPSYIFSCVVQAFFVLVQLQDVLDVEVINQCMYTRTCALRSPCHWFVSDPRGYDYVFPRRVVSTEVDTNGVRTR